MSITSSNIQRIVTTGQSNPSFTIDFPVYDVDDIWVWKRVTATGVLEKLERGLHYNVSISNTTGTLTYVGTTDSALTSSLRVQKQMKRVQFDEYKTGNRNATYKSYEQALDKVASMNQQSIQPDPNKPNDFTAGVPLGTVFYGDRVGDLVDGTASTDAATKSQVDTALGGGTSAPTIASADVGQWLTANSSNTSSWEAFTGTDDPKGNEYKYYTVNGWVDINNLATIAGSGDNGKLLMDINGVATWTTANQYLTTFADSATATHGRPYTLATHSSARVPTVRDYMASPPLLPNIPSQRLSSVETGFSTAVNKMEYKRSFTTTQHSVSCAKKSATDKYYSGLLEQCDHPVYVGTVANPFGSTGVIPFFTSHVHEIPNDHGAEHTTTRWFKGAGGSEYTDSGMEDNGGFTFVFNIISVTTSTITFAAASTLHENSHLPLPLDALTIHRFIKHPETLTINFNILWYEQK
tara:strand:+ start:5602 stop:6999 length:1398 start_codon:yes stop_codon:yes gene_type:complete